MSNPNPRDLVYQVLSRWTEISDPPFLPERSDATWAKLSARDRPFAYDLLTGILRWRGALDAVIVTCLKQPIDTLDHPVRVVLWLGSYQLLFQGTADYAAVDTAVDMARRIHPRISGLVNAVLRNITRLEPRRVALTPAPADQPSGEQRAEGAGAATHAPAGAAARGRLSRHALALDFETEIRFNRGVFFDPVRAKVAHLAAVRSFPAPLVAHMLKIYPDLAADLLLAGNQRPVVTLRVDRDTHEIPVSAGVVAHESAPRFLVAADGWNDYIEQRVAAGTLSPQDPTSALPVRRLAGLVAEGKMDAPRVILDLCAGLGTKSVQFARAFPESRVLATDIDALKLARLESRVKGLKLANISPLVLTDLMPTEAAQAGTIPTPTKARDAMPAPDLVLLDVPCSNTGVLAKRVQSRWRWPTLDRPALAELQMKLLRQGAGLLRGEKEGGGRGVLVYATCSIDPEENGERVRTFMADGGWELLEERATLPSIGGPVSARHDGGYYAVLRRTQSAG